jgi:CRISPR type III-A-associated RAMP protein Csm4
MNGSFDLWVEFKPDTPWRIGPDSGDRDRVDRIFHSDAIYSAVSNAMARLGWIEEWLDDTARAADPSVRFSSCFPMQGEHKFVVPPRSLWPPPASAKVRWKGARFVPLSVVEDLVNARALSEDAWIVDGPSECLVPQGASGPFRISVRSSAAVDRLGESVAPHSTACLEFAPQAGLWMAGAFRDPEAREKWKPRVVSALRLLGSSGFGGERSNGWGRAALTISENESRLLPAVEGGEAWWMLSLFQPSPEDAIDWKRGSYALTTRGGRVETYGDAKKPTRMIAEGSVVVASAEPRGTATDVAPENFPHPVYRAGYAVAVPIPWRAS